MAVRQPFYGPLPTIDTATAARYISPVSRSAYTSIQVNATQRWPAAGTWGRLRIVLPTSPGASNTLTHTLVIDGVDTDVTVTHSGSDTDVSSVAFAAMSYLSTFTLKRTRVNGGTPASISGAQMWIEFDGAEAGVSAYGGCPGVADQFAVADPAYNAIFNPGAWGGSGSGKVNRYNLVAVPGALRVVVIDLSGPLGDGNIIELRVVKNDAIVASLPMTGDETSFLLACDVTWAVGDYGYLEAAITAGTPPQVVANVGTRYVADSDGYSQGGTASGDNLANTTTEYHTPNQTGLYDTYADAKAYVGASSFLVDLFVVRRTNWLGTSSADYFLVKNGSPTALLVTIAVNILDPSPSDPVSATGSVTFGPGNDLAVGYTTAGTVTGPNTEVWGFAVYALATTVIPTGIIGPLAWVHMPRRQPDGTVIIDTFSDQEMQCPGIWENGFKDARVERFGSSERRLSHRYTGAWTGAQFQLRLWDGDRRFREQLISSTDRYWTRPFDFRMTTRANRAVLGHAYVVFVGPPIEIVPARPRSLDITLSDIVSQALLSDDHLMPWRMMRDGFLDQIEVSDSFDLETPERIILGQHRRIPDVDPPSPQGFIVTVIYLGIEDGEHVGLLAGHACAEIPDIYLDLGEGPVSVLSDVGTVWRVPGHSGEPKYEDRRSSTFGDMRRYSLIRGIVGNEDVEKWAAGTATLLVAVDGVEDQGDGSGTVITSGLQQYKHIAKYYIAFYGQRGYQSGLYADMGTATWSIFGTTVPIIDEDSFDTCDDIATGRLGGGYPGAFIIGAQAGDRSSVKRWIADMNRSFGARNGITRLGQYRVVMLHPTSAIKAAARIFTDATEIIDGTFDAQFLLSEQANRIPFKGDYEYRTGIWKTTGVASADEAVTNYERDIPADPQTYPGAPGITMLNHRATLEARERQHPPRPVALETAVGPDEVGDSAGYLDFGDYFCYRSQDAISASRTEIRLAFVEKIQVQAGKRRVRAEGFDCDDLIGYDEPDVPGAVTSPTNDTCAEAIEIDGTPDVSYTGTFDTTTHQNDDSLNVGSPPVMPYLAANVAWFKVTPAVSGQLFVTTAGSDYDTQLAILTGTCGASPPDWTVIDYNDNDGLLFTSILDVPVTGGTEYYIAIAGVASPSGGRLLVGAQVYVP